MSSDTPINGTLSPSTLYIFSVKRINTIIIPIQATRHYSRKRATIVMGKSNYRHIAFALCMMYPGIIPPTKSQLKYKTEMSYLDKVKDERLTETMNANWSHYYGLVKKLSSLTGQWPYQRPITRLFCMILMTLSTISMIIPQVILNSH